MKLTKYINDQIRPNRDMCQRYIDSPSDQTSVNCIDNEDVDDRCRSIHESSASGDVSAITPRILARNTVA